MPSSGTQFPSYNEFSPTIQKFHQLVKNKSKLGSRCPLSDSHSSNTYYMRDEDRQQFFNHNLPQLIREVLPSGIPPAFDYRLLQTAYTKLLAVLLDIKRANSIGCFLGETAFDDNHLPCEDKVAFLRLVDDEDFFGEFYENQWKFCAQELEPYVWRRNWEPKRILPFQTLEKLGEGAGGTTYLIRVDPAYNKLHCDQSRPSECDNLADPDLFVLKVFDAASDEYQKELETLARLHLTLHSDTNIIGFYGGYRQHNTYNIILEYANNGNLEEYLQRTEPPTRTSDIYVFWKNILKLPIALKFLHNFPQASICHHDIAPRNILVSTRNTGSLYDCSFKLADFDVSRLMKRIGSDSQGRAAPGTRTYGAPECFDPECVEPGDPVWLNVGPGVDVWSLGCVLSEVATWLVHGKSGLEHYRTLRIETHDVGFRDSDSFHDGLFVLDSVRAHHGDLRSALQKNGDTITEGILTLVDAMLKPKNERLDASEVRKRALNHLEHSPSPTQSSSPGPSGPSISRLLAVDAANGADTASQRHSLDREILPSPSVRLQSSRAAESENVHPAGDSTSNTGHEQLSAEPLQQQSSANRAVSASSRTFPRLPIWSVETMSQWRKNQKPLPSEHITDLRNRDYVFIIDDSTSMRQHWSEVINLLDSLAYLVKKFDRNGMDLYFTHSDTKVHAKKSRKLVETVRKHQPPLAIPGRERYTDIDASLGNLLEQYRKRIQKYGDRRRSAPFHCDVKKMIVYVFTDGQWQPHSDQSIERTLRLLVETLKRYLRRPKQIGVQFIQFGDDNDARKCLEWLDNGLGLGEDDIVDTEPAHGNGFKMLLGAINKWADRSNENTAQSVTSQPTNLGVHLTSPSSP